MSLDLLNDFSLDVKVHSIQSTIPIGGGGSIPDNSILNIKLVDKTVENTKIKDGTINSNLLAPDITISGDLEVAGNFSVPTGSLTVGNADITNNLTVNGPTLSLPNGDLSVGVNISAGQTITGSILVATTEVNTPYILTTQLHLINGAGNYLTYGTSASLVGGVLQISTSAIAAASIVLITRTSDPTVDAGYLAVRNIVPSTSFEIQSSTAADNGTFNWLIINPT